MPSYGMTDEEALAAKRRSLIIDKELKASFAGSLHPGTNKKTYGAIKLLVLGPSESGKSTYVKQLRMMHDRKGIEAECAVFRWAIILTIIHAAKALALALDTHEAQLSQGGGPLEVESFEYSFVGDHTREIQSLLELEDYCQRHVGCSDSSNPSRRSSHLSAGATLQPNLLSTLDCDGGDLHLSFGDLSPDPDYEEPSTSALEELNKPLSQGSDATAVNGARRHSLNVTNRIIQGMPGELFVRPACSNSEDSLHSTDQDEVLMQRLVQHAPRVKAMLAQAKSLGLLKGCQPVSSQNRPLLELSASSMHMAEHAERIAGSSYVPSDEDILILRIATVGIEEHVFSVGEMTWRVCDPAGRRGARHKWAGFFDDATAIIFICAISSFDLALAEDSSVNRMMDALSLFKSIAENKILSKVAMILFLNKCDVLAEKLTNQGIRMTDYFPDYKGRNNAKEVCHYFAKCFMSLSRKRHRKVFVHFTTAISPAAMKKTNTNVQEVILRSNLTRLGLM